MGETRNTSKIIVCKYHWKILLGKCRHK